MNCNKHYNGFIFTEIMMSFSLIIVLSLTIIPIFYQLTTEQMNLYYRREIHSYLHDHLIARPFTNTDTNHETFMVKQVTVNINYTFESPLWKGCASWKNEKNQNETICLFYYPTD
ncbi:hypothetical protein [Paraliobacillus sp. PM-2]|uniref:hypothetical protein n=1 Tax=Paraliobacillus sp. PM-2 TaxID=1462524 RepID=UPI000B809096|nr:hypothetical protein [Paraliobacillus sp. PM-2]